MELFYVQKFGVYRSVIYRKRQGCYSILFLVSAAVKTVTGFTMSQEVTADKHQLSQGEKNNTSHVQIWEFKEGAIIW
jgi:hypothetical protein